MGYLQVRLGNNQSGIRNFEKALTLLRKMKAKNPQNVLINNQIASVNYYLGDVNFRLASQIKSAAPKFRQLRAALSFFEESYREYSSLPQFNISFPQEITRLDEIQNRIAACQAILSGKNSTNWYNQSMNNISAQAK